MCTGPVLPLPERPDLGLDVLGALDAHPDGPDVPDLDLGLKLFGDCGSGVGVVLNLKGKTKRCLVNKDLGQEPILKKVI